ncbi:MAG: SAM-dependent chlorinase/fluorinase [Candidatus Riflebacteria bacterium]|nr:SAM-dependent chlorinase/fluorinase [Candidatus Riflebacteria bacterium]
MTYKPLIIILGILFLSVSCSAGANDSKLLNFITDFGNKDGGAIALSGVVKRIDPDIRIGIITNNISQGNIWEAANCLFQTTPYWPDTAVFVCIVNPKVFNDKQGIVVKNKLGQIFVGPDNGVFSLVALQNPPITVRQINEKFRNLKNYININALEDPKSFFNRDIFAYIGAMLASNKIAFDQVGSLLPSTLHGLNVPKTEFQSGGVCGGIPCFDKNGNLWTTIPSDLFDKLQVSPGNKVKVTISRNKEVLFNDTILFTDSFSKAKPGEIIAIFNNLSQLMIAQIGASFVTKYQIFYGPEYSIHVSK